MTKKDKVVVVGLGEVGKPLLELVSRHHDAIGVDISPVERIGQVDILHVCYPFQIKDFVGETVRYIELFQPTLTIINSTVAVGTTRAIAERTGAAVVNSPVRGKHARMLEEVLSYTKFVGAMDIVAGEQAAQHFESVGLKTKDLVIARGNRTGKAHRNDLLRPDDRLGPGGGAILRSIGTGLRRSRLVL